MAKIDDFAVKHLVIKHRKKILSRIKILIKSIIFYGERPKRFEI